MPKAVTTPGHHMDHGAPVDSTTTTTTVQEIADRSNVGAQAHQEEKRLRSPQQFYAELTKRPDVQAFLKRLADR